MKNEIRCSIELRADDSRQSPGRLVGTLMEYGQKARSRNEVLADNSLYWDAGGILINLSHDRKQPLMRILPETREGSVIVECDFSDTQRCRDAATMIRDGTLKGLSV